MLLRSHPSSFRDRLNHMRRRIIHLRISGAPNAQPSPRTSGTLDTWDVGDVSDVGPRHALCGRGVWLDVAAAVYEALSGAVGDVAAHGARLLGQQNQCGDSNISNCATKSWSSHIQADSATA